jgi:thymidylate kinase
MEGLMNKKLCPKIILEGTRLTFKTEIAFALNEHPQIVGPRKYRYHSPLISAEWGAFTNFPWGRGLINFTPEEEALAMETYHTWVRLIELQRYYSWIIDRFHISTRAYQIKNFGIDYRFNWLEQRLKPLGFHLVLLIRSKASFDDARKERLKVSGNPAQYDDINIFIEEQDLFRQLVSESILPTLTIDISDNSIGLATTKIAEWLKETGGLWLD